MNNRHIPMRERGEPTRPTLSALISRHAITVMALHRKCSDINIDDIFAAVRGVKIGIDVGESILQAINSLCETSYVIEDLDAACFKGVGDAQ